MAFNLSEKLHIRVANKNMNFKIAETQPPKFLSFDEKLLPYIFFY